MTTECPTCGRDDFKSERGMKMHHSEVHGESIAGKPVECENCGKEKRVLPTYFQQFDRFFCGEKCRGGWRQENWKGDNCPNYDRVQKKCKFCDDEIQKTKCQVQRSDNHFCSTDCQIKWQRETDKNTGKNSPTWKGGGKYYGPNWTQVRKEVRERDNHTCQKCKKSFDKSESGPPVHHIEKLRSFNTYKKANKKENLVSLCQSCHMELESLPVEEQIEKLK